MKTSYLNKIRIREETSQSRERMHMLMPSFVIDKISNFEISSRLSLMLENSLSDDAGDIAVLFCDICEFDEVIRECQSSVVEIMDEVFRTFDSICKSHGIQKIETVGKTYMAAGGLKFIENKLDKEFKNRDFSLRTVDAAQKMIECTQKYMYKAGKHLKAKIGIHYGSCIFGVLGYHKPQFSLIGDTINTTSRYDIINRDTVRQPLQSL
jgi:class 3 adenylate cyclase